MYRGRFGKRKDGQLLLLTGIMLTITLLTISMILVSVYNRKDLYNPIRIGDISSEMNTIKESFGSAVESEANEVYFAGGISRMGAVRQAYETVRDRYVGMEQAARIMLDISTVESIYTLDGVHFNLVVKFVMTDGTTTLSQVAAYTIKIHDEFFAVVDNNAGPITVYDRFDTKNTTAWHYNSYQTVPYSTEGNNVVMNTGTGVSWSANFYRNTYQPAPFAVTVDFMVDIPDTRAHFALESNGAYHRWCVIAGSGKIYVQYRNAGTWVYPKTLIDPVKVNTWYTVTLVANDVDGFYLTVQEKYNPTVCANYTFNMDTGYQWRFHHWARYGHVYIDNYLERGVGSGALIYATPFYGSMSFGLPVVVPINLPAGGVCVVGDFTSDDNYDIAYLQGGDVHLIEKIGEGMNFRYSGIIGSYVATNGTNSAVAGDLDGDGNLDIAVANNGSYPAGEVRILFGNGKGDLPYISRITLLDRPDNLNLYDIDMDGYDDIVMQNGRNGKLVYCVNYGNGTFDESPLELLDTGLSVVNATTLTDADGDGHVDILCQATDTTPDMDEGYSYVWFGQGMGVFQEDSRYSGYPYKDRVRYVPYVLTSAGNEDLVVTRSHDWLSVWINTGSGYYTDERFIGRIPYSDLSQPAVPVM